MVGSSSPSDEGLWFEVVVEMALVAVVLDSDIDTAFSLPLSLVRFAGLTGSS